MTFGSPRKTVTDLMKKDEESRRKRMLWLLPVKKDVSEDISMDQQRRLLR